MTGEQWQPIGERPSCLQGHCVGATLKLRAKQPCTPLPSSQGVLCFCLHDGEVQCMSAGAASIAYFVVAIQLAQALCGGSMLPLCLHGGEVQFAASGAAGVARFVVAVPANITHHVALPWSEKVTVYKGWWGTIKKEAKHYWVRS